MILLGEWAEEVVLEGDEDEDEGSVEGIGKDMQWQMKMLEMKN